MALSTIHHLFFEFYPSLLLFSIPATVPVVELVVILIIFIGTGLIVFFLVVVLLLVVLKAAPAIVGVHGRRLCHHHVLVLQVLLVKRLFATSPGCLVVEDLVALTEIIIMLNYGLGWSFLRGRLRGR